MIRGFGGGLLVFFCCCLAAAGEEVSWWCELKCKQNVHHQSGVTDVHGLLRSLMTRGDAD